MTGRPNRETSPVTTEDPSEKRLEQAEQNGAAGDASDPKRPRPAETRCRCGSAFGSNQRCARGHLGPGNSLAWPLGNLQQLKHGARARTGVVPAYEAIDQALARGPGAEPRFQLARQRAAAALARLRLLEAYIDKVGMLDGHGSIRPAFTALMKADESVRRWLGALGLDPTSASRLGVNLTAIRPEWAKRLENSLDREMDV